MDTKSNTEHYCINGKDNAKVNVENVIDNMSEA